MQIRMQEAFCSIFEVLLSIYSLFFEIQRYIWDALHDLVPFVRFKKNREKHPWRSVMFSKVADFSVFHVFKIVQMVPNHAKHHIWVKVFKNGPRKICGWQPLKNLKWYGLPSHFWIHWPMWLLHLTKILFLAFLVVIKVYIES